MKHRKLILTIASQFLLVFFVSAVFSDTTKFFLIQKGSVENVKVSSCEETEDDERVFDNVCLIPSGSSFFIFNTVSKASENYKWVCTVAIDAIPLYLEFRSMIV